MWARSLLLLVLAPGMWAQQDPAELLQRALSRIANTVERLPHYMCTQTVDRTTYESDVPDRKNACEGTSGKGTHRVGSDRLRLDVAMSATGEIFSWAGAGRFSDRDLSEIVHGGANSTGPFAALLTLVFRDDNAHFTYDGDIAEGGRTLAEFGFRVAYETSHYFYGQPQHRLTTGYDGTFLVDPKTADLIRLSVRTNGLPTETGACYASTTLDYTRVQLGGGEFLLPSVTLFRVFNPNGSELENRTVFANCREFIGESAITFDPPAEPNSGAAVRPRSPALAIPPGLPFRIAFAADIDTATASAGDMVVARLTTPILDGSRVLVPKGATVHARLLGIHQLYGSLPMVAFEFRLEAVDVAGVVTPFAARLQTGRSTQEVGNRVLRRGLDLGTIRNLAGRSGQWTYRAHRLPCLVPKDLVETTWLTAAPVAE